MIVFTKDRYYVQTGKEAYNISVRDGNLTIQQVIWTTFNLPIDTPLVWVVKKRMGEEYFSSAPPPPLLTIYNGHRGSEAKQTGRLKTKETQDRLWKFFKYDFS